MKLTGAAILVSRHEGLAGGRGSLSLSFGVLQTMKDDEPLYVDCGRHGKRVAAVVCCHMIESREEVGFVENSDDLSDLQAWCERCEEMFLAEGDKTEAFEVFNDRVIVCRECYSALKAHHAKKS
jgi:hypothetical protein